MTSKDDRGCDTCGRTETCQDFKNLGLGDGKSYIGKVIGIAIYYENCGEWEPKVDDKHE